MFPRMATLGLLLLSCAWGLTQENQPKIPELIVETFKITVRGTPEPIPALKYQLLPKLSDMQPGNPVRGYLKCFMEQDRLYSREEEEQRDRLLKVPLDELPDDITRYGASSLKYADYAARLTTPDWEALPEFRRDGFWLVLPEVQKLRSVANVVKLRLRGEIKDRMFDKAVYSLQTIFGMGRNGNVHPSLIAHKVGSVCIFSTFSAIDEFISQSGSPNLFYAFTYLPKPLLSLEHAAQGEQMAWRAEFKKLTEARHPWIKEQLDEAKKLMESLPRYTVGTTVAEVEEFDRWVATRLIDKLFLDAQIKKLITEEYPAEEVRRFLPEQLLLHHFTNLLYEETDRTLRWIHAPYSEMLRIALESEQAQQNSPRSPDRIIARALSASPKEFRYSQIRIEQRLAMYQVIEAIRLHLNTKKELPNQLKDIKYSLPLDPVSGTSFVWNLNNEGGLLSGEVIPSPGNSVGKPISPRQYRYQLVVGK
jgi:hypothetical protein